MDVSIIIVNYKTPQLCIDCINSVFEKTQGIDYEIIVVDNDSQDNSIQILSDYFGDKIKLIDAKANLGFGKANNLGAKYAIGEYLFLLNSDTILRNNAIKILFDFISADKKIGIVGGNLFDANGKPAHSFMIKQIDLNGLRITSFFSAMRHKLFRVISNKEFNDTTMPIALDGYITGADLLISRSVFEEVGGFDKDFFMYFEESELTCRVHKFGYKVYSVPQAEITHLEGASTGRSSFSARRQRMYDESAIKYFRKVFGEESVGECYKVLISNYKKIRFRKLLQFDFDAAKKAKAERKILKQEYKDYLNNNH
jgi:hypothetical protein